MKTIRGCVLCLIALLVAAPLVCAQEIFKYRSFSLGTSVATILKQTDQKPADMKVVYDRPALIQELTWWAPNLPRTTIRPDNIEQIVFSFCNGTLYKMTVIYDRTATEGLTVEDMIKSISAKYGQTTNMVLAIDSARDNQYGAGQKLVASWEDSQYSLDLIRFSFSDQLGLLIYSKQANVEAEVSRAAAAKVMELEGPQKEANRRKKEADDLELVREKNRRVFQP